MPNPFNITNTGNQPDESVTTTSQATLTFAGAPTAVTLVWSVLSTIIPSIASSSVFPVVLSLIVGMAIYAIAPQPEGARHKAVNFFFALINSFAIAATTLGISSTLGGPAKPTGSAGVVSPSIVNPPTTPVSPSTH